MYLVDVYLRVRRAVMVEGMSVREASRVFGLHRDTVRKMLAYSTPPGYRRQTQPRRPKLEPFTGVIDRILEEDHRVPRKQRHTAKRIYERLRDEYGFDGGYTIVKDYVREHRQRTREMFVPLSHPPGQAQCDFGEALVVIGGVQRKAHCFVLDLPHSDGCFVKAYPAETTEAFLDGHVSAFSFLGGVPQSIIYDNTKLAVAGYWATANASAPAPSRSCSPTTCSRTVSAVPARARSKAWWATRGATSWCLCRPSRASMRSMPIWSGVAWSGWTPGSEATMRALDSGRSGTWMPCCFCLGKCLLLPFSTIFGLQCPELGSVVVVCGVDDVFHSSTAICCYEHNVVLDCYADDPKIIFLYSQLLAGRWFPQVFHVAGRELVSIVSGCESVE